MSVFYSLFKKELRMTFYSPIAYIVMFFFWVLSGLNFWWSLIQLADGEPLALSQQHLFSGLISFSLLIVVPLITMRAFAEERKLGTLESLLTTPVRIPELVLAKFAGAMAFYIVLWLPVLAYAAIQQYLTPPDVPHFPDYGAIGTGFIGILLVGGLYVAVGLLTSSLTSNQIVAAIGAFAFLSALFFTGVFMAYTAANPSLRLLGQYVASHAHLIDFSRGVLDSRIIALYLTHIAWLVFLSIRIIETKRK